MSTRSTVFTQRADGSLRGCYIHCDGYPSHRGLVCLANAVAGTLDNFIHYYSDPTHWSEYDYVWDNESDLVNHIHKTDWQWTYIQHFDGSWRVIEQRISDKENPIVCHENLKKLVADNIGCTLEELEWIIEQEAAECRKHYSVRRKRIYRPKYSVSTSMNEGKWQSMHDIGFKNESEVRAELFRIKEEYKKEGWLISAFNPTIPSIMQWLTSYRVSIEGYKGERHVMVSILPNPN